MTSLYCEASIEPRSLSAAFHSVSFSSFMVMGAEAALLFERGGIVSVLLWSRSGEVDVKGTAGDSVYQGIGKGIESLKMKLSVEASPRHQGECLVERGRDVRLDHGDLDRTPRRARR